MGGGEGLVWVNLLLRFSQLLLLSAQLVELIDFSGDRLTLHISEAVFVLKQLHIELVVVFVVRGTALQHSFQLRVQLLVHLIVLLHEVLVVSQVLFASLLAFLAQSSFGGLLRAQIKLDGGGSRLGRPAFNCDQLL